MISINKDNFKKEVIDFKGIVVADFYADWCGPCRMLSPILAELDQENKDKNLKYVKINVDADPELAGLFKVMSIPTVIFFKNGQVAEQKIGVGPKEDYLETVKSVKKNSGKTQDNDRSVTVFTTPTCPYCHMVKSYLKEKKIAFKEVDVAADQAWAIKMVSRSGQMGVPQIWVGPNTVVGFNKPEIDRLLNL